MSTGDPVATPSPGSKGRRTRARILEAAEEVFGLRGYHEASIAEITGRAGVAQGSFYIYFPSKLAIFEELIVTRGREMRERLRAATEGLERRADIEAAGFRAFFAWIAEHPHLYRVARQAEFVRPELREAWYREFAEQYAKALQRAMEAGQLAEADPEVLAWAVMGMADFVAMRWIVWGNRGPLSTERVEAFARIAIRALGT